MTPKYRWHPARYVCSECSGPTEASCGPDQIVKVRCQDCDYVGTFDPAADQYPSDELERVETDGGREQDSVEADDCDHDWCLWHESENYDGKEIRWCRQCEMVQTRERREA